MTTTPTITPEYQDAVVSLEHAYKNNLRVFCDWASDKWKMRKEDGVLVSKGDLPTDEYILGWNAALKSLNGALDLFIGEVGQ